MDHLPYLNPSNAIEVPCIVEEVYDGQDFCTYPARKGWSIQGLLKGDLESRTPEETAAFLQSWLFFGLLVQVIPIPVKMDDFIQEGLVRPFITTKHLARYVKDWQRHVQESSPEQSREEHTKINKCFETAFQIVQDYCSHDPMEQKSWTPRFANSRSLWPLSPEIALSIMTLADSLSRATFKIYEIPVTFGSWGSSALLISRMLDGAWCPNVMSILTSTAQTQMLYYASTLGSPRLSKYHTRCTKLACAADMVLVDLYQTKHIDEFCLCPFVEAPVQEISDLIQRGSIPLVICVESNGNFSLEVQKQEDITSIGYVAISHVWSDGLGNPNRNALPKCQLQRIQRLVSNVHPLVDGLTSTPFWMDTLCVPVGLERQNYRNLAIRNMASTYKRASVVLVLDGELRLCNKDASMLELYTRIKLSGWMRRLWTLQEGMLAYDTFFQFSNGARSLVQIVTNLRKELVFLGLDLFTRFDQDASYTFFPLLQNHRTFQARSGDPRISTSGMAFSLNNIWRALQWRSTSHRGDETVCLATLLGLDPGPLLQISSQDYTARMIQLLRMLPKIPLLILFQPPPYLLIKGFRWAPPSFLASFRGAEALPAQRHATVANLDPSKEALLVTLPGLFINIEGMPEDYASVSGFVIRLAENPPRFFDVQYIKPTERPHRFDITAQAEPAVILAEPIIKGGKLREIFGAVVFISGWAPEMKMLEASFYMMCILNAVETEERLERLRKREHWWREAATIPGDWVWRVT